MKLSHSIRLFLVWFVTTFLLPPQIPAAENEQALQVQAAAALKQAARYYHDTLAVRGGYVYHYTPDLKQRWGEGLATQTQIWVQPPGTPTVGMAFLKAYRATGEQFYLDAATAAAEALVYGQLQSGGWTNMIDFNPRGRVALYRNGNGKGKNNSSLDDGQTQSALKLLIQVDEAHQFQHLQIHKATLYGLSALLQAQFSNGAFPQVWTGPVAQQPAKQANYPDYNWQTEGRIKNYWDMYTLNDNVCGYLTDTLIEAYRVYGDEKYKAAVEKLGLFLLQAQMPEPQPAWAQQYNYDMQPIWARKFEPPGISGDESQEVIETLLTIAHFTGDRKYLQPIPTAIAYLKRSLLPGGQLARYYELKTNKPLYMTRRGKNYSVTFDDSALPKHYNWKTDSRLDQLQKNYDRAIKGIKTDNTPNVSILHRNVEQIIEQLDRQGRWISTSRGERLIGQAPLQPGTKYIASAVFSKNLETLSAFLEMVNRN